MTTGSPLRVAVVAPRPVPYQVGGAERHWDSLVAGLHRAGHHAELVTIDSPEETFAQVLGSYRAFLELDVSAFDVVISGKYPSWMVRHRCHIRHLNHPLRGLYERYPPTFPQPAPSLQTTVDEVLGASGPAGLIDWALACEDDTGPQPFPGPMARAVVQALDKDAAQHVAVQATVSDHVARRPGYIPEGATVAVVPPLTDLSTSALAQRIPTGQHFLVFGRLTPIKRTDLAIRAFARAGVPGIELWIAGTGPEEERLRQLAAETPGVTMLGHCTDDELAKHLARSIAVVALPEDEDFGLVAAEAMAAERPVITTTDSGGVAEQVEHEVTGLVCPPFAATIGKAMQRLATDRTLATRLGQCGGDRLARRSWQPMVRLVEQTATATANNAPPTSRPKVLILSTFRAEPVRGGGARRLRSMATALQATGDVTVLALSNEVPAGQIERRLLTDGVVHVGVARSSAHLRADAQMAALVGLPVDDIGCAVLHPSTPQWHLQLSAQLGASDVVILAHPFLAPSLANAVAGLSPPSGGPLVMYDAHNVELDLKTQLLADRAGSTRLLEWVARAEKQATDLADVVAATSDSDGLRLAALYPRASRPLTVPNGVAAELLEEPNASRKQVARSRLLADLGLPADDQRPIVLFVASNHPPNHEAADRLVPVAAARPDLIVVLAGAHSERARPSVHNFGRFDDASHRRLLLAADVALNTVAEGSGTNLKLIEALAVGTPVVATDVGARGLDNPERYVAIATEQNLASRIDEVLADPATAERVRAGQTLAQTLLWTRVVEPLESVFQDR